MANAPAGAWAHNYTSAISHSPAVAFLGNLPRWGARVPFAFGANYILNIARSAIITIIAGLVIAVLLLLTLFIRMGPRRASVDVVLKRIEENPSAYLWHIAISVLLSLGVALFLSLGFIGASVLIASVHDVVDTIEALLITVKATGFAVVDLFMLFAERLKNLQLSSDQVRSVIPVPPDVEHHVIVSALSAMRSYSLSRIPDIQPLREALSVLLARIEATLVLVETYADVIYIGMMVLLLLQLFTPVLHCLEEIYVTHNFKLRWRLLNYAFYIAIPALSAWLLLAVASTLGLFISDVCEIIHDYRREILNMPGESLKSNPIIEAGLLCLPPSQALEIKKNLNDAIVPLRDPLFGQIAQTVLNVSSDALLKRAEWSVGALTELVECQTLVELSGKLENIVCGQGARSLAQGVMDMWVAFLGLALVLSLAFFCFSLGIRIPWAVAVWPPVFSKHSQSNSDTSSKLDTMEVPYNGDDQIMRPDVALTSDSL